MSASKIEWTDCTWNPVRGCSRVSEGCRNCYAERQAARFSGPGEPFDGFAKQIAPRDSLDRVGGRRAGWTGKVELIEHKLVEPFSWRKPRRVFVNSMSDLFHESLPDEAIDRVFAVMALAPQHTFQVLTKRPERMRSWFNARNLFKADDDPDQFPPLSTRNRVWSHMGSDGYSPARPEWPLHQVWLGVSVEDQATAEERIPILLDTPAAVRFVSYEPALGPVDLAPYAVGGYPSSDEWARRGPHTRGIDWLIVGGESGPGARPCDVAWIRSVVAQCKSTGVACFVKQLGARPVASCSQCGKALGPFVAGGMGAACGPTHALVRHELDCVRHPKGGDPSEWPEDLRVREFPQ